MNNELNNYSLADSLRKFFGNRDLMIFTITVLSITLLSYLLAVYIPAIIVGILLAYLIEGIVYHLHRYGCPRNFAISGTLLIFIFAMLLLMLIGVPILAEQIVNFARSIPEFIAFAERNLQQLPSSLQEYTNWDSIVNESRNYMISGAEVFVKNSATNLRGVFTIVVYCFLIPLLVFFLLRDKVKIFSWIHKFIPDSEMTDSLKQELNEQFGAYVRGKIIEGIIVFAMSYVPFTILGLNYAFTLSVAIGLSVIVPFVGAIAVTVPVVIIGLTQFGLDTTFWWVLGIYILIQIIDGQLIVPLLFSNVVKMHPVAILVAILVFGTIWGVWGVVFAIPLASLIKSYISVIEKKIKAGTT